jgi:hypothetical protein
VTGGLIGGRSDQFRILTIMFGQLLAKQVNPATSEHASELESDSGGDGHKESLGSSKQGPSIEII